jgi:hypothetical protein
MVNVGIFYDHLKYFMAVWYSLWSFVIPIFPNLVCLDQEKSGNPGFESLAAKNATKPISLAHND